MLNNRFFSQDYRSLSWFNSPYVESINNSRSDIIQLNWINNFLSISDIGKIKKPLVWRFSDMWPILGAKHYVNKKMDVSSSFFNYLEKNIFKKRKHWKNKIDIIAPSKWLENQIRAGSLIHDWPITVIYTPINIDIFRPLDRSKIRSEYKIDNNRVLIFGADNLLDKRKGLNMLLDIFKKKLIEQKNEYTLFIFGKGEVKEKKKN